VSKDVSAPLQALLDSRETTMVNCWKVTRKDGTIQGFTEHDLPLTFDSLTYEADSGFTATKIDASLGLSVDNLDVEGALSSDTINEDDLATGQYDDAQVELFWVNFEDPDQRVLMNKGNIGQVKRGEYAFNAELRSQSSRLQQATGRVFTKTCDAIFGDAQCKVLTDLYESTGEVTEVTNNRRMLVSGLDDDVNAYYTFGLLTFTSGLNNGLPFEVKRHEVGGIALWNSPPYDIEVGDTFTVIAGCDKYHSTCSNKFGNILNFRGFNFIPGSDFLTRYASRDGSQQGESIFNYGVGSD